MNNMILVVDDEREIADLVEVYLQNSGFDVCKFYRATEALDYIRTKVVDLAILDVMMPDMDGFTMCQQIREQGFMFPIIMLTARVEDVDKIRGLTIGADDYITKPFNMLEVVARVRTQLRRYTSYNAAEPAREKQLEIRGLVVEPEAHRCTLNGQPLELTPTEFNILQYLCEKQGTVVSTEELFEAVWKVHYFDDNNTVMAHISKLRAKMQDTGRRPKYIRTVWGVGYTID
ncbi:MAG: VanR-ABDEGLN family response regulator transcription factor [Firmicutes bacterium]|nr:VanR-ABDEGLN family response regulator transcription factor [Bacillota bacterium]